MNTTMIVATQMQDNDAGNFAAKLCADYSATMGGISYGDWYLPSRFELNLLYLQRAVVGGFSTFYWSSCENPGNHDNAYGQSFDALYQGDDDKGNARHVRAIRPF